MKANTLFLTISLSLIGVSSAFAGFSGDTAPVYSSNDGMMHIMSTSTGALGGDIDEHGCKPSAGYSYSESLQKCIRPWEVSQTLSGTTWKSLTFDKNIFSKGTLSFSGNTISAKICNAIGGNYTASNGKISAPALISTEMYCSNMSGKAERKFNLDGATYRIIGNGKILKIQTTSGNTFTWRKVK